MPEPALHPAFTTPVGRYIPVARLGAGAMGEVWKAWDPGLNRWAALKFVKHGDATHYARFQREAKLAAQLDHPDVARIYETGEHNGTPWIAMQFIDGRTLKAARPASWRDAVRVVRDAARAIAYANALGIIHRDIKPENLMVSGDHVWVMDFGLARMTEPGSTLSATGIVIGTPAYMSPEQARGEGSTVDARSDVWALGTTLYDLVCLRTPFPQESMLDLLMAIIDDDPVRPREAKPDIDPDLETVILKCLQKEPADRYQTADELADDLDRLLTGVSVTGRVKPRLKPRHRVAAGFGVLLAIAAILAVALGLTASKAAGTRDALLAEMRQTSAICLEAAFEKRRAGDLDGMAQYARTTEELCRRVSGERPELAEPHVLLARIFRALMEDDLALCELERALAKEPGNADARFERGLILTRRYDRSIDALREDWRERQAATIAGRPGLSRSPPPRAELEDADARSLKERALKDLEGLPDPVVAALVAWLRGGDNAAALFESAAAASSAVEIFEWRGRLAREKRRYDETIQWLTDGLARDRGYVPFYTARASALHERGKLDAAIADYTEAIRLRPKDAGLWRLRGNARSNAAILVGREGGIPDAVFKEAIADLDRALELAPGTPALLQARGMAWMNLGQSCYSRGMSSLPANRAALRDLDEALRLDPARASSHSTRAVIRFNMAQELERDGTPSADLYAIAIEDVGRAIERRPDIAQSWFFRGVIRCVSNVDLAKAVDDFTETLRLDKRNALALVHRGDARAQLLHAAGKNYGEAEPDFLEAVKLAPDDGEIWHRTGWFYLQWNAGERQHRAALDAYEKAVALIPKRDDAYTGRGQARARLGMDDALVLADFSKAITLNPGRAEAWYRRGLHRTVMGTRRQNSGGDPTSLYTPALADLIEAQKRAPGKAPAFSTEAELRWNWGRWLAFTRVDPTAMFEGAIRAATEELKRPDARQVTPLQRARMRTDLATWKREMKQDCAADWKAAAEDYGGALQLAEEALFERANSWYQLGLELHRQRRDPKEAWQAAVADFDDVIRKHPSFEARHTRAAARTRLGTLTNSLDLLRGAVQDYSACMKELPQAPELVRDRGAVYGAVGRILASKGASPLPALQQAIDDSTKALELAPKDTLALDNRGTSHLFRAMWGEKNRGADPKAEGELALKDYEAALAIDPRLEPVLRSKIADAKRFTER